MPSISLTFTTCRSISTNCVPPCSTAWRSKRLTVQLSKGFSNHPERGYPLILEVFRASFNNYVSLISQLHHALRATKAKYAEAEPLYERSQALRKTVLGPEHPYVPQSLHNRVGFLRAQVRTMGISDHIICYQSNAFNLNMILC